MKLSELSEFYGNLCSFVEAFTSVNKQVEKGVMDDGEDLVTYQVTFNEYEFVSFAELCKFLDWVKDYLELNGIDTSTIKMGRKNNNIDWDGTSLQNI